ncbi:MAG: ABC transporter substrate-binding protein [Chloroflexota bacterium]|nr:ABC transporter substrate-binding protein [Chloroflexota bacterium]
MKMEFRDGPPIGQRRSPHQPALTRRARATRSRFLLGGLSALAVACGAAGQAPTAPAEGQGIAEVNPAPPRLGGKAPVRLTYWKSLVGPRHDAQVALVESFNASRPDVHVTLEHAGEYSAAADKLRIALASGAAPDVAMLAVNTDLPAFARGGALQPLDPFFRGGAGDSGNGGGAPGAARGAPARRPAEHGGGSADGAGGFYPGFIRDSRIDGRLYQLPFARSTPLLYVNVDLLRAAGLPETPPSSWPELLETSRPLLRIRGGGSTAVEGAIGVLEESRIPAAYGVGTSWWEFQSLLWSFGGAFSDQQLRVRIDDAPSVEAMQFLADLVHRHRVALATKTAQQQFLRGQIAFLTVSSASLTQIEGEALFRVVAAPLPGHRRRAIPGGGSGLSLLKDSGPQRHAAGWDFLSFMTSAENTAAFARATGYTPVRPAALRDAALQEFIVARPNARTALSQLADVQPTDAILAAPSANRHIEAALSRILFDGAAVPQTCADLAQSLRTQAALLKAAP